MGRSTRGAQSGYLGVRRKGNKWMARVTKDGIEHCEYGFDTAEEAAEARDELAEELHGPDPEESDD